MSPRELPVIGGHLALDFANTVDNPEGPTRHDHLGSYADLLDWSVRTGTLAEEHAARLRGAAAGETLHRAHHLRDVLNDVFGAAADGRDDLAGRWPRLRPFVVDAQAAAEVTATRDGYAWTWSPPAGPAALLHPVAYAAAALLTGPDLARIKRCAGCPWLFLDRSRNHSRRWCDMGDCGTVEKMQRYVARRSARRAGAGSA